MFFFRNMTVSEIISTNLFKCLVKRVLNVFKRYT